MAQVLLESGRAEEALQLVTMARQDGGEGLELDLLQARALHARGMLEEAVAVLAPRVQRAPRVAALRAELGLLYFDLGRMGEAEAELLRAVELEPSDPAIRNNLGFLLLVQGRPQEAVVHLRECVRLDPSQERARNNLGYALVALGREDEALRTFLGTSDEARARASMGLAWERVGASDKAILWYRRALEADPGLATARARLDALAPPGPEPPSHPIEPGTKESTP